MPKKKVKDTAWEVFTKATTRNGQWDKSTFPRLSDALFWIRYILAIVIGIAWAVLDMRGQVGVLGYVYASSALVFCYYSAYLNVDVDDYGQFDLISELYASFGLFSCVVSYITVSEEEINGS